MKKKLKSYFLTRTIQPNKECTHVAQQYQLGNLNVCT